VIRDAARIRSRLDLHALEEPDTLPRQRERAGIGRRDVGEVDIEASRIVPADRQQLPDDAGTERRSGRPADLLAIGPCLAQRDRRNAQHHPGHRPTDGAGKYGFHAEIGAAIDAAQ